MKVLSQGVRANRDAPASMPRRKPWEKHAQAAGVKALHAKVERLHGKAGGEVEKPLDTDAATGEPARSDRTYTWEGGRGRYPWERHTPA